MGEKNGSVLSKLHKTSISIKDFASQAWCEKQMELYFLRGMKMTKAMEKGMQMHQTLQKEVFIPLAIEPVNYADRLYKTAYENYTSLAQMQKKKFCREIKVYGSLNGYKLVGVIDELRINDNNSFIIEDKTVNGPNFSAGTRIKSDSIQVMLYKKALDEIKSKDYTYENFANAQKIDTLQLSKEFSVALKEIGIIDELRTLSGMYKKMFEELYKMPPISNILELRYLDRNTNNVVSSMKIQYDSDFVSRQIKQSMGYWNGDREAQAVPENEKWKCNMCTFFGNDCTVWYKK